MDRIGDRIRLRRQGLQLALLKERTSDAAVIRIFVHQVVLYDESFLIEFNFKGAEGLERSDLLGFDLSGKWWSIDCLGRTLIIYRGRVLLFFAAIKKKQARILPSLLPLGPLIHSDTSTISSAASSYTS